MSKYTVIADVGRGLLNMLRDKLVPEPVERSEYIGICDPKNRGDFIVGIHPYNLEEDASNLQGQGSIMHMDGTFQDPPTHMELNYMISVASKAPLETKALEEAKIIGRIIQVFKDNPVITQFYMNSSSDASVQNVPISMLSLDMEEKVKIWSMFNESYKMSLFYIVGPVSIDSSNIRKPRRRVESIYLHANQHIPKKIIQFETDIKEEDIDDEYVIKEDEEEDEEEYEEDEDEEESEDESGDGDDDFSSDDDSMSDDSDLSSDDSSSDDFHDSSDSDLESNDSSDSDLGTDDSSSDDSGSDADLGTDDSSGDEFGDSDTTTEDSSSDDSGDSDLSSDDGSSSGFGDADLGSDESSSDDSSSESSEDSDSQ